jgi:integral membrane protein
VSHPTTTPGAGGDPDARAARLASRFFVAAAILEALGWIALLLAMYVKWIADGGERGVEIFGPIHGVLFIVYLVATVIAAERLRWTRTELVIGLASGVPPLFTVLFERWMAARGRLYGGG